MFSTCGTFTYLVGRSSRENFWIQKIHQMDISPIISRMMDPFCAMENSVMIVYFRDNASVDLELMKLDKGGFWIGTRPAVLLENIASYSSHYANSDKYLLLGENYDEKMRLFIAPQDDKAPIIKTLSLTFAEARSRLQKEWERLQPKSQDQGLGRISETSSS